MKRIYPEPILYKGVSTHRFWACTSYFDMPYFCAYAHLIDIVDEKLGARRSELGQDEIDTLYDDINHDMFKCIMYNFGDFHSGMYFKSVAEATDRYIDKRPVVREWLLSLRAAGKKVYLITNSSEEYADLLMNFAFGVGWRDLFDLIVLKARKPHFFLDKNSFFEVRP
jgi:5'-nucleotidase